MDEPPPLCAADDVYETAEDKTVMDEMVQVAMHANKLKKAAKLAEQKKRNQTFGNGLKKGFFSQPKPKSTEPPKPDRGDNQQEIPTIRSNPDKAASLRMPEVQAAMAELQNLKPSDWMTPEFFQKLAANPRLCQALKNPRFTSAIEEMSTNPAKAAAKYQNDPDLGVMFKDFLGFLGTHFEDLAKAEETSKPAPAPAPSKAEVQRSAIENMARTPEEEQQVQRILSDPELQEILADPDMRNVLYACQTPGGLQMYMKDSVYGPKIRKLASAGLVQLHA